MKYINQLDFPHIRYNHNMAHGGPPDGRTSVKTSGCGLCCACMVVEQLTEQTLSVEECVTLSEQNGANLELGTTMRVLGEVVAKQYDLDFSYTNDIRRAIAHLKKGGRVIALVGGDREDYVGLFTKRGHYILLCAFDGEELRILDPSYTPTKFDEPGRVGRVRVKYPFVYCSKEELVLAAKEKNKAGRYYLFSNKK